MVFEYDVIADRWTCSPALAELYSIPPGEEPTTELMAQRLVDEDRDAVLGLFAQRVAHAGPFVAECSIVGPHGALRRLVLVGQSEAGGGEVKQLSGFVVDITDAVREGAAAAVSASSEHRAAIEQAKGALMVSFGVREDVAFDMLRSYSNRHNIKLVRVAEHLTTALADPSFSREDPVRSLLDILIDLEQIGADGASGAERTS